ncbi:MAG: PAS domain S-box protein [Desulfobacterales bacterium]
MRPAGREPSILILNSYHPGYSWSDREIDGFLEGLKGWKPNFTPYIEHLDQKRFLDAPFRDEIERHLRFKYRALRFDLLVAFDDAALPLALRLRRVLFPETPLVFAGVDEQVPAPLAAERGVTGVLEKSDIEGTLGLALRLTPGARRVLFLHDETETGLALRRQAEEAMSRFRGRLEALFPPPLTFEEAAEQVAMLPPDAFALILSFATDRAGRSLSMEEGTARLTAGAKVPVYALRSGCLGHGIIGGMLLDGREHGLRAAALARRVLAGEEPAAIPVDTSSSALPMFDYRQLERFGIGADDLTAGARIVNRPPSFHERHRKGILAAAAFAPLLGIWLLILLAMARRKRLAEKLLAQSEERFRLLYEEAPLPYVALDEAGAFLSANDAFLKTLRLQRQDLPGRFADLVHPAWQDRFRDSFRRLLSTGEASGMEFELRRADGEGLRVFFFGRSLHADPDGAARVHGILWDITALRRTETELESQRQTLAAVFESVPHILLLVDREVRIVRINRAGALRVGRRPEEIEGLDCGDALFCAHAARGPCCGGTPACPECAVRTLVARSFTTGETVENAPARLLLRANGGEKEFDALVSTARVTADERDLVLVSLVDVTEARRMERELRASEERLGRLIESAPDGIYIQSGGVIQFANPTAARIFGASAPEDLVGRPIRDLIHPEEREALAARLAALDAGLPVPPRSFRVVRLDGRPAEIEVSSVFIRYRGRDAVLVFARDVTEQKKLERGLVQAQKMEAIGTLAGGIAHDFNNILGVIVGNAELMAFDPGIPPAARGQLEQILAASRRAKNLVRQILAFSRHSREEKLLINLKPIVKETLEFLRSSAKPAVRLEHFVAPDAGAVFADPTQMQQVVMNLCTNAVQALPEEGGLLRLELGNAELSAADLAGEAGAAPGRYVVLTVTDTGCGMSPELMGRIFEPFFTTKGPERGTGLGLAVVHGIVHAHGGFIKVFSEPGRGSTFKVFLPRAEGEAEADAEARRPLPTGTESILLVDDEAPLADLGRKLLEGLGYRVEVRTAPLEALAVFRAAPSRWDLVITDLAMPQMNGLRLARELLLVRPGVPVILCTGFGEPEEEQKARAFGIRAVLHKPLLRRELAEAVRRVLDEARRS